MLKLNQTISCLALAAMCLSPLATKAQLSTNPDKFLGNITTRYSMDAGGGVPAFYKLWNQVTPENESKWASVEGNKGTFNWGGADNAFNYAKNHNFTYKFHALVWGAQYPSWLENQTPKDRYASFVNWFNKVKAHYPHLPLIDVVNEAVGTHQPGNPMIKESWGGGGKTGYDWLIKAFEMAYERFPNSILIYNDYNTFQWNTNEYIDLVRALRDSGAPIDAYGCQSHDLTDCNVNNFKTAETNIQNALKMPFYSTEYDIGTADDALQLQRYKEQIPYMWEKPYCAGITLWGYVYGATWTTDGNSGLYKNGAERPAMTWLKEYMASDAAKNAKSPFPGMKKRVGVYIKAKDFKVAKGDTVPIKVRTYITDDARKEKADIAIDSVLFYDGSTLISKMTAEPYIVQYSSTATGYRTLKAVVYTNDGNSYERYSRINVLTSTTKREPFNGTPTELPGTIDAKEFDKGASGVSFYNAARSYTTATKDDGWMEYTVDVKEKGIYSFDIEVAATKTGGRFHLSEYGLDNLTFLSDYIDVPKTGSSSSAVQTLHGVLKDTLTAGIHTICMNIEKGGFYVRSLTFNRYEVDNTMTVTVVAKPATISVGDTTQLVVTTKLASGSTSTITGVNVYSNDLLIGTVTKSPDTLQYVPTAKGSYSIVAIATNSEGKSKTSSKKTLKVNGKRIPYKSTPIVLPGIIQAENFDKGGEGFTFHDKDSQNEGDASYRTDNEGLDLVKGNSGTAIGYTSSGEWTEYTVNVKEPGEYSFEATCSNGSSSNGGFTINTVKGTTVTKIGTVTVTPTGGWDTYKVMTGKLTKNLAEGEQILRFTISSSANCNIDKVNFICTLNTGIQQVETLQPQRTVIYNLKGQKVDANYKGIIIKNGRKVLKR
ncbi:endo-1,4-beta-xylanase [Prevotella sp. E2-28]|uniref:endo-1,4-beta-xylanase n=1 Tax=Prevotella sp. E2-28 TaxID=2913620 RepID=UPI001ED9DD60|nr:endo-1,4-beta-xylanase [Prevotella sp. E2-28]UKK53821.1 endo-1,4-beta-xylanase [Prevotella sp. E2-28]